MRGDAFARQLKLLALLEGRPEGIELEEAAGTLGTQRRTVYRDFQVPLSRREVPRCFSTCRARHQSR